VLGECRHAGDVAPGDEGLHLRREIALLAVNMVSEGVDTA
jgi:hypothetical protein